MNLNNTWSDKHSQIWVETAIYTLIGLTLIAIVLSIAIPYTQKIKDRSILEQTAESLNSLDNKILETKDIAGNTRIFFFNFEKGRLELNSINETIIYTLENTNLKFSEPEKKLRYGEIYYLTETYGKRYNIILELNYTNSLNLTFNGEDKNRIFYGGSYKIRIENVGDNDIDENPHIDFDII